MKKFEIKKFDITNFKDIYQNIGVNFADGNERWSHMFEQLKAYL